MSKQAKALGATRDELVALRSIGEAERKASRLKEAARRGFLELQLIARLGRA